MMEDLTIYENYDKLLKANTNLSTENFDLHEKIVELENTIIDLKACLRTCANSAQGGLDQYS